MILERDVVAVLIAHTAMGLAIPVINAIDYIATLHALFM